MIKVNSYTYYVKNVKIGTNVNGKPYTFFKVVEKKKDRITKETVIVVYGIFTPKQEELANGDKVKFLVFNTVDGCPSSYKSEDGKVQTRYQMTINADIEVVERAEIDNSEDDAF